MTTKRNGAFLFFLPFPGSYNTLEDGTRQQTATPPLPHTRTFLCRKFGFIHTVDGGESGINSSVVLQPWGGIYCVTSYQMLSYVLRLHLCSVYHQVRFYGKTACLSS